MTSCLRCACVCIAHDVSSSRKIVNQPYARAHAGGGNTTPNLSGLLFPHERDGRTERQHAVWNEK